MTQKIYKSLFEALLKIFRNYERLSLSHLLSASAIKRLTHRTEVSSRHENKFKIKKSVYLQMI